MKNILIRLITLSFLIPLFIACDSEGVVRDYGVTSVQKLYNPDNGKAGEAELYSKYKQYYGYVFYIGKKV